jgi:tetratricopeptide (TPR) repeat protein
MSREANLAIRPSERSELSHIAPPVATALTPPMIADTPVPKIRHGAFVAALGGVADADMASSPRWQALCAGFTTLRLIDAWATEGRVDARAFAATCATVATLPRSSTARGLLGAITSAVGSPRGPSGPSPYIPLLAYGRLLEYDADWALAIDAYSMIAEHGPAGGAADLLPDAYHRSGYCRRMLGDLAGASADFTTGRKVAQEQGNTAADLQLRLSEANVITHRGNLPEAARVLEQLIADASAARARQVAAAARHDCGLVSYAQGQFERAALLCYDAAQSYDDPRQRARALSDLAACSAAIGHRDLARQVNEIVYTTAATRELRWAAAINLLEMAVTDGREPNFEAYRSALEAEPLPVTLAANYHLYTGRGHVRFGRPHLARQEFGRALGISMDAALNQIGILADQALAELALAERNVPSGAGTNVPGHDPWSPEIENLTQSITELYLATVEQ